MKAIPRTLPRPLKALYRVAATLIVLGVSANGFVFAVRAAPLSPVSPASPAATPADRRAAVPDTAGPRAPAARPADDRHQHALAIQLAARTLGGLFASAVR